MPSAPNARLRDQDRLDVRLAGGSDLTDELRDLARSLTDFHERCDVRHPESSWELAREGWRAECDQIDLLAEQVASAPLRKAVRELGNAFLAGRKTLFEERAKAGRCRDGHGDLRCEHIYLTGGGVRIIDCLEFDEDRRSADTLSDVALLIADLHRLGQEAVAERLMTLYREFTGDTYPPSLLHFYVAYRALVRAKVAALRAQQTGKHEGDSARLIAIALEHLLAATPVVTCIGGLPGAGKSAVGTSLASRRGDVYLSSDEIRHERATMSGKDGSAEWEQGAYVPAETEAVYAEMLRRAAEALARGYSVVLDASWRGAGYRQDAHDLAAQLGAVPLDFLCQIDERTALARVRSHREGFSRAGVATRAAMTREFDDWPGARVVTTDRSVQEVTDGLMPIIARELRTYSIDSVR